jgi:glutaredoxin-dependent peroxiredoxin
VVRALVEVGQNAPDIEVVDTEKKPWRISDFKGKVTVLAFYPGAFTGVCTKEMCTFRDSLANFNDMNSNVVGISVDSPFSNKSFKAQNNLNFTLLSDYNRDLVKAFGIPMENFSGLKGYTAAKRAVFVLDNQGIIRWKWVSDNPGVEPNYEDVKRAVENAKAS